MARQGLTAADMPTLATIIATSWASAKSHRQHKAVDFELLKTWGPMIFIGVVFGTAIAGFVDGRVLTLVFAVTALLVPLAAPRTTPAGKK